MSADAFPVDLDALLLEPLPPCRFDTEPDGIEVSVNAVCVFEPVAIVRFRCRSCPANCRVGACEQHVAWLASQGRIGCKTCGGALRVTT